MALRWDDLWLIPIGAALGAVLGWAWLQVRG